MMTLFAEYQAVRDRTVKSDSSSSRDSSSKERNMSKCEAVTEKLFAREKKRSIDF
jgi:hypothetical protein